MDNQKLSELIQYIISEVDDKDGYTTTIRLVKFLYLIDLEYWRTKRTLLTNLKWIFYNYGPYAFEIQNIGSKLGYNLIREEFKLANGYSGTSFHSQGYKPPPSWLDSVSQSIINRILEIWCDQDTSTLLNYVYFETEPMIFGKRNEPLDFSIVEFGSRFFDFKIKTIDKNTKDKLIQDLRDFNKSENSELIYPINIKDELYFDFIKSIEDEI